nr:hypothetical protein [Streptomyces sp. DSM 41633]
MSAEVGFGVSELVLEVGFFVVEPPLVVPAEFGLGEPGWAASSRWRRSSASLAYAHG